MTKDVAKELNRLVREASGLLDRSTGVAQDELSSQSFDSFRREVGLILGEIYFTVLEDLWEQYPDLLPESMKTD